ncbi:MAG: hypothetical protein ACYC8T_19220 [Myxococcaceae bacterium]
MSLPKHLDEAAARLDRASERIERARAEPPTLESHREWLEALTDFVRALADIHQFTNESVHEKLHELAGRVGFKTVVSGEHPESS